MGLAIESFCSLSDFLLFWKFDSSQDLNEPASKELEDLISPQRGERTGDGRACGARYLSPLWKYPHLAFPSAISRPTLPSPGEAYSQSSHTDHPPVYILFFFFLKPQPKASAPSQHRGKFTIHLAFAAHLPSITLSVPRLPR